MGRLRARQGEMEQATLTRASALSEGVDAVDSQYAEGLRIAVSVALDYGLEAIGLGDERTPPVPAALLYQARLAARNGVGLNIVLSRYFAGYTLLGDFLLQEAQDGALFRGSELQLVMQAPAAVFERLIAAVMDEYRRESESRSDSAEERRAERARRLLAGELLDTAPFEYEFDVWHIGAVFADFGSTGPIRQLANELDRQLLLVGGDGGTAWAWLGGRRRVDVDELKHSISPSWPAGLSVAVGEPAYGLAGWRITHQQAQAASLIALRCPQPIVRYADVALLASMLQDDLLVASLHALYLAPLSEDRDGGEMARETLRAYFAAQRNISSAAAAIGVNRRTVANRLQAIEARLGFSLGTEGPEIEAALRLHDLGTAAIFPGAAPVDS